MLRRLLGNRLVVPAVLTVGVGLAGVLTFGIGAGAQSGSPSTTTSTTTSSSATAATGGTAGSTTTTTAGSTTTTTAPAASALGTTSSVKSGTTGSTTKKAASCKEPTYAPGPANSGTPTSSTKKCSDGQLIAYGNSSILYQVPSQKSGEPPSAKYLASGEALFEENCSSCHGPSAQGSAAAPNLVGVGPATVMFWVTTGRMPAKTPLSVQAPEKPPVLSHSQAEKIAAWINSLDPSAPYVPKVNLKGANLADGASLFALNCAACHTITGAGDALAFGTSAPNLRSPTTAQIAEAIRTGPGNMPRFTGNLSDAQVRDLVAYVRERIEHPTNQGGFGLGGVGPVAEGFVALLIGVGVLVLVAYWIGERA